MNDLRQIGIVDADVVVARKIDSGVRLFRNPGDGHLLHVRFEAEGPSPHTLIPLEVYLQPSDQGFVLLHDFEIVPDFGVAPVVVPADHPEDTSEQVTVPFVVVGNDGEDVFPREVVFVSAPPVPLHPFVETPDKYVQRLFRAVPAGDMQFVSAPIFLVDMQNPVQLNRCLHRDYGCRLMVHSVKVVSDDPVCIVAPSGSVFVYFY